jgi:hypothetical protein
MIQTIGQIFTARALKATAYVIFGCVGITLEAEASQYYSSVTIGEVNSNWSAGCLFLTIPGVGTADSAVSSSPWVGIPVADPSFAMIAATVLQAKATGAQLDIATTGALAGGGCGAVAGIAAVILR